MENGSYKTTVLFVFINFNIQKKHVVEKVKEIKMFLYEELKINYCL